MGKSEYCAGCKYVCKDGSCDYICIEGRPRGCDPGEGCKMYQPKYTREQLERMKTMTEEGKPWEEIAKVFGAPMHSVHTAYKRWQRTQRELQGVVEPEPEPIPEPTSEPETKPETDISTNINYGSTKISTKKVGTDSGITLREILKLIPDDDTHVCVTDDHGGTMWIAANHPLINHIGNKPVDSIGLHEEGYCIKLCIRW